MIAESASRMHLLVMNAGVLELGSRQKRHGNIPRDVIVAAPVVLITRDAAGQDKQRQTRTRQGRKTEMRIYVRLKW